MARSQSLRYKGRSLPLDPVAAPTLNFPPVPPSEIAVACLLAACGAMLQGSIGFGLAVVSAPILLLIDPVWIPGPMLLAAMLLVVLITQRDRQHIIGGDVALGMVGRFAGTIPAAYAVHVASGPVFDLLFATVVLAGVVMSATGSHIPRTRINLFLASLLSGIAGTISSIGGPPMALVYQHERGPTARGTMSAIFVVGTLISLIGLWWAGRFGQIELVLGLILIPPVLLGFWLSRYTAAWLDQKHLRPAILAVSAASAFIILARALYYLR